MNPSTQRLTTIWPAGFSGHSPSADSNWLSRALCFSYVLADFRTLHLPVREGDEVRQAPWRWALGLFKQGQYEVLGAWPARVPVQAVAKELHDRGIEHIKAISADEGVDCTTTYPNAVAWPPVRDPHAAGPLSSAGTFGPRRRAALQSAAATAERLQASLTRTIKRQAPFADEGAAVAFLMHALENADRQLQGLTKLPSNRARRPPAVAPSGSVAVSGVV
jgi:hypothetical protein